MKKSAMLPAGVLHLALPVSAPFPGRQPLQEKQGSEMNSSQSGGLDAQLMDVLKNKVLQFRDVLGLPPRNVSGTLHELLLGTLDDLRKIYPKGLSCIQISDIARESPYQVLLQFYKILKHVGDLWLEKYDRLEKIKEIDLNNFSFEQLGELVLERLDCIKQIEEMFDLMERGSSNTTEPEGVQAKLYSNPLTPTSVLPEISARNSSIDEFSNITLPPLLRPLRLQAVGKLKPIDMKRYSFHMFPLVLDHNFHLSYQKDDAADDLEIDSPDALMIMQPISSVDVSAEITYSEATTLASAPISSPLSQMTRPRESPTSSVSSSPMFPHDLPNPSAPSTHQRIGTWQMPHLIDVNCNEDGALKPSKAANLVSPSVPFSHLKAPLLSPTSTPPPSPIFLTGIPMIFRSPGNSTMDMEPMAYAMNIDGNDHLCSSKPSESSLFVAPQTSSMRGTLIVSSSTTQLPSSMLLNKKPTLPAATISPIKDPTEESSSSLSSSSSSPSLLSRSAPCPPATPPPPKGNSVPVPPPPPPKGNALSAPPPSPPIPLASASTQLPLPPPPPALPLAASSTQPPSLPSMKGAAPPPPAPQLAKALRAKKTNTKLKRSTQMGNLYRLLKGKVEGPSLDGKTSHGKKNQIGSSSSGNNKGQGMADALAEMTKRSAYFRQIEEDVEKHAATILEMKSAINSFETKDKVELLKFHQHVEKHLENLSDETQVLARFEGFPSKKLEAMRMAAALYAKFDTIVATLKDWKVASPIAQQLDKVESYFNKIKEEVDVAERNKVEESKRFQSQKIEFDFSILLRIKECMVDLSSNCIEKALKESKDTKELPGDMKPKPNGLSKMLWRAFQLAFRVYSFAGGQDDRADRLTSELAHEIETCPQFYPS